MIRDMIKPITHIRLAYSSGVIISVLLVAQSIDPTIICPTDHPIEWLIMIFRSIISSSEQSIWCCDPNRLPNILRSDGSSDSQINCVHIGTTDRPNVWLIRRTTIPRLSIDLNRFNQIDVNRRVSLAEANLFRSDGRIYFWRSYRSDRSRIFERMIQQIDTMCFLSIINHIRLTELLDRVIHQIG